MFTDTHPAQLGIRLSEVTGRSAVKILTENATAERMVIVPCAEPRRVVAAHHIGRTSTTSFVDRRLLDGATPASMAQYLRRSF